MAKKIIEKRLYRFLEVFTSCILAFSVLFALNSCIQLMSKGYVSVAGYSVFKVVTGSMEPTIPVDALLLSDRVDIETIEVGDIVCFESKSEHMRGSVVTHRVVDITNYSGFIQLTTRGDANTVEDTLSVTENNLIGKVVWHSEERNVVTSMISFLSDKIGFLAVIVLPVLLICGFVLRDNMRKIQVEMHELEKLQLQLKREKEQELNRQKQMMFFAIEDDEPEEMESVEELKARLRAEIRKELGLDDPKETKN